MKIQVRIKVERTTVRPDKPRVVAFEKVIDMPDGVSVPFDSLYSSLLFLFGADSIVSYEIVKYGKV